MNARIVARYGPVTDCWVTWVVCSDWRKIGHGNGSGLLNIISTSGDVNHRQSLEEGKNDTGESTAGSPSFHSSIVIMVRFIAEENFEQGVACRGVRSPSLICEHCLHRIALPISE